MTHFLDTMTLNGFHWIYIGFRIYIATFCLYLTYIAMGVPQEQSHIALRIQPEGNLISHRSDTLNRKLNMTAGV